MDRVLGIAKRLVISLIFLLPVFAFAMFPAQAGENPFAVDQVAYVERAKSILKRLLDGRKFYAALDYLEPQGRAKELLDKLRTGELEVLPPFEWSDDNPDLPTYQEVREKCPNFDFEFSRANGSVVRATENFALYKISFPLSSFRSDRVLAYRAERFILQFDDWGRRRVFIPGKEFMYWPGYFRFFDISDCILTNSELIQRHDRTSFQKVINEIITIDGQLLVVKLYPLSPEYPEIYRLNIQPLNADGGQKRDTYTLSTFSPKAGESTPPTNGDK